jgi:Fe-S-cluster containining protein
MESIKDLCTDCGHCCNGNLFQNFNVDHKSWKYFQNLRTIPGEQYKTASQHCQQLDSCNLCKIYKDRPTVCRDYECNVLLSVKDNSLTVDEAKVLIKKLHDNPNDHVTRRKFTVKSKKF